MRAAIGRTSKSPPLKRVRAAEDDQRAALIESIGNDIGLPTEVWGHVLDFLPFKDVLQCSAVSKIFLKEVLQFITALHIYSKQELRVQYGRRFNGGIVQVIDVFCLITCLDDDNEEKFSICQETACRIVPFLTHFPKVHTVGLDVDANGVNLHYYFRDSFLQPDSVEIVRSLVRSICGGYQSGAFSQDLIIYGPAFQAGTFICYKESGCSLCKMYCNSFPLMQAVNARAICLPVKDRLSIIANRPNGKNTLSSSKLVLELLRHHVDVPFRLETSPGQYITEQAIVFGKQVVEELGILCKNYFDAKTLDAEQVLEALTSDSEDEIWLVKKYHEFLCDLGIPVSDSEILVVNEENLLSDVHLHM